MRTSSKVGVSALALALGIAHGCGGHHHRHGSPSNAIGAARLVVHWPGEASRGLRGGNVHHLVAAIVRGKTTVESRHLTKPDQLDDFTGLPPGDYKFEVRAYESADGTGPVLAGVGIPVTVKASGTAQADFSLTTDVDHLELHPSVLTLDPLSTGELILTARDAWGMVVLGDTNALTLESSAPQVATCVLPGTVTTGATGGVAVIRATDHEYDRSAQATITVRTPPGVGVLPAHAALPPRGACRFAATTTGLSSGTVAWSVREGMVGGTIAKDGSYVAPPTEGFYHVVATSVADPRRKATAAVTVGSGTVGVGVH